MRLNDRVTAAVAQQLADVDALRQRLDLQAGLGLEAYFLVILEQPVDRFPRRIVFELKITLGEQRQRGLKRSDRNPPAFQLRWFGHGAVATHEDEAGAEQPARKHRHAD